MTLFGYSEKTAMPRRSGTYPVFSSAQEPSPHPVEKIFSDKIQEISSLGLNQWEDRKQAMQCIDECVSAISKNLEHLDFSLPLASRQILEQHWELFDQALKQETSLDMWEPERIRSDFRHACLTSIKTRWCTDAAQHFYRILLYSDQAEKVNKAQIWSEQFTAGAFYLRELARRSSVHHEHADGKILSDTIQAEFRKCYQNVMEQRTALMFKLAERNPVFFAQQMDTIEKKQKDFLSLSADEQEVIACTNYGVGHCTQYWPDLENQIKLLNASISSKYPQGNTPQPSFAEVLDTLET